MAQSSVLKVVCLLIINALYCMGQNMTTFDGLTANTSVWLSAAAYCETDTFMSRAFSGYSAGFQTRFVVENHKEDVQVSLNNQELLPSVELS